MGGSKRPTRYLERPQRIELELWMSVSVPFFYDTFNQLLVATAHFEICAEECSVEARQLKRSGTWRRAGPAGQVPDTMLVFTRPLAVLLCPMLEEHVEAVRVPSLRDSAEHDPGKATRRRRRSGLCA